MQGTGFSLSLKSKVSHVGPSICGEQEQKHKDGNQSDGKMENASRENGSSLAPSSKPGMDQILALFHERKKNEHSNHINQLVFCFQLQFPELINYFIK